MQKFVDSDIFVLVKIVFEGDLIPRRFPVS